MHTKVLCPNCHLIGIFWQNEGKESQGAERGCDRIGAGHPPGQGPICPCTGPISYSSKDQSQGPSAGRGESSHGRVILNWGLFLLPPSYYIYQKFCPQLFIWVSGSVLFAESISILLTRLNTLFVVL